MPKKPSILAVNDDGAGAPGLWALFHRLESFADPVILAPMREQSARSHAVTIRQPMALAEIDHGGRPVGWRLDGMPADCVKLALSRLYAGRIDLVVSGINAGANTGHNILYSGTVAAAIEAAMYGIPALAVSLYDSQDPPTHYDTAALIASRLARDVLAHGLPPGVILNINVPDLPIEQIEGVVLTRQGVECFIDLFDIAPGADGERHCANIGDQRKLADVGHHSSNGEHPADDFAVAERLVSITPLHFNLTSARGLDAMRARIEHLNARPDDQPTSTAPQLHRGASDPSDSSDTGTSDLSDSDLSDMSDASDRRRRSQESLDSESPRPRTGGAANPSVG